DGELGLKLWDAVAGKLLRDFYIAGRAGSAVTAYAVAWAPDGKALVMGASDRSVRLYDAATGKETRLLGIQADMVWSVAWSPDGRTVASAGRRDGIVHLYDSVSGRELFRLGAGHLGGISRVV